MKYSYLKNSLIFIAVAGILVGCENQSLPSNDSVLISALDNLGCQTSPVKNEAYQKMHYVSILNGVDEQGAGTKLKPFKSITFALSQEFTDLVNKRHAILVAEGYYHEDPIQLIAGVDLLGGFSADTWERDISRYISELNGEGKNRIMIGADSCIVDGFVIRDGQIRGKGAALICEGTSPTISNNVFYRNKSLMPEVWNPKYWHETAHDGGAIWCSDGAAPIIINNIFIDNQTENGRGAAIACQTRCQPRISDNVFAYNISGLKDPMRSSDGGAVSIFDWCSAHIENNLFIGNKALSSNDAGALFLALWSSARIKNNIFVENQAADDAGALFVGGQEHRYDAPLDSLPSEEDFFIDIEKNIFAGNKNSSRNSGAMRFTMESRGRFAENLVVHNQGIYFQRSEVLVEKNIILDNFLFIETKMGLKPGIIRENIIWADFSLQTSASVINNNIRGEILPLNNFSRIPQFKDDGKTLPAIASNYSPLKGYTEILLSESMIPLENLESKIIKAGNHWGVIKMSQPGVLEVWGDVSGELELIILPSYRLINY